MECEARIDDWLDRELMLRLALVLSLEEGRDEVVEGSDDGGGVDSKLAMISLPFIEVDADDNMEVFVMLDEAPSSTARRARSAAKARAALRAALILFCLLRIVMPSRKALCSSTECHNHHGVSWDYQSSFSEQDNNHNQHGYLLWFDQYSR